ncbi:unnamed protein product [Brachionus calyciflorus]|uniref:Uncharacterized protein n=1 Tax=Brachionus calyciflorus TaxID=104777 RepID=A0A814AIP7_9BILA|nr:unnamed protein product [Brachionus calyciflorus]
MVNNFNYYEIDDSVTKKEKKIVSSTKSLISSDDDTIDSEIKFKKRFKNEEQDEKANEDEEEEDEEENYEEEDDVDEEDEVKTDSMSYGVWQYFKRFSNEVGEHIICQVEGCEKKWNSEYLMVKRMLEQMENVNEKKFAIVDDPNERQNFNDFSKNAIVEILELNGNYSIAQPVKAAYLDESFDDKNYLPKSANQIENNKTLKKEIETYEIDSNCEKESMEKSQK